MPFIHVQQELTARTSLRDACGSERSGRRGERRARWQARTLRRPLARAAALANGVVGYKSMVAWRQADRVVRDDPAMEHAAATERGAGQQLQLSPAWSEPRSGRRLGRVHQHGLDL